MKYEFGKKLADVTTLKIGGNAHCWFEPENFEDIIEAIKKAKPVLMKINEIQKQALKDRFKVEEGK